MKKQTVLFSFLIISTIINAQDFQWAKSMGGNNSDFGKGITTDYLGNLLTTGMFRQTVDFDPGSGTDYHVSEGDLDIFVQKLDSDGNFLWAISEGGSTWDYSNNIATDSFGNIYLTGLFQETVDFDPGPAENFKTTNGGADIFIQKLDPDGNLIWIKTIGGTMHEDGYNIAVDSFDNVYITGLFEDTVDFDPSSQISNLTSNGDEDIYILKLNSSGEFLWAVSFGGVYFDRGLSIEVDNDGNIYTTGFFGHTVDFDPGNGIYNITTIGNGLNAFIQKLDSSGSFLWAKAIGGDLGSTASQSMVVDETGNTYITGGFVQTVDFDPGEAIYNLTAVGNEDIFISKLDTNGEFVWAKSTGGNSGEIGNSIALDGSNNVISTGFFHETVDFDPGSGIFELTANGRSGFMQILNSNGDFVSAIAIDGNGHDEGHTITSGDENNIYISGVFSNTVDFDPSENIFNLSSNGALDIFILKLFSPTLNTIDNVYNSAITSYPNPTNGKISLLLGKTFQKTVITVTTILGQTIIKKTAYNTDKVDIDLNGQPGVYFCNLVLDENIKKTIKIIKN